MIKQGHEPKSFYFILSGRVTVYKVEGEMRVDLNELGSGDAFGELALLKGTRRTASVKTNVPCEFFRIDRDDFLDVLKDTAEEDIKQKLDFFTTVPFLAVLPSSNLLRLAELCSKREWPANTVIVREREHVTSLSLIRAGSVRVLRLVPFTKVACNDHRYSLAVCPPPVWPDHSGPPGTAGYREAHAGTSAVSALASAARHAAGGAHPPSRSKSGHETDDSNVVWKLTCTGLLHSKGYFGQESILVSVERHKDASSSSEHHHVGISPPGGPGTSRKSMTAASGRTPRHATAAVAATLSPHSIVTCEPTDIFRINRVDVLKLLTPKALAILEAEQYDVFATADPRELVPNPPLEFGIPLLVIQTAYLASHAWAAHRKKVLRQIVADKKCRRERKIKSFGLLP
ncbi:hypothetical protein BC828DRAFT_163061 [Blastocladiella britannica]|nr:hypothetical protein BC828DRAFT_163061 [Blastocladiella britannica]